MHAPTSPMQCSATRLETASELARSKNRETLERQFEKAKKFYNFSDKDSEDFWSTYFRCSKLVVISTPNTTGDTHRSSTAAKIRSITKDDAVGLQRAARITVGEFLRERRDNSACSPEADQFGKLELGSTTDKDIDKRRAFEMPASYSGSTKNDKRSARRLMKRVDNKQWVFRKGRPPELYRLLANELALQIRCAIGYESDQQLIPISRGQDEPTGPAFELLLAALKCLLPRMDNPKPETLAKFLKRRN